MWRWTLIIVQGCLTNFPSLITSTVASRSQVAFTTTVVYTSVVSALDVSGCWLECNRTGYYCPEFCCQPLDGLGNPSCWDVYEMYTFSKCCSHFSEDGEVKYDLKTVIGEVTLELYRGPSQHNAPKFNERTVEVSLGLWFMRRNLRVADPAQIIEIGNVLSNYWPKEEYIQMQNGIYLPWQLADLEVKQDATLLSFEERRVLSISTVEHVGHDNEGATHANGFRSDGSLESLEVVASNAWLRNHSRVLRRINAQNAWEVDRDFEKSPMVTLERYRYDLRDAYWPDTIGLMFHPELPKVYHRIYGSQLPPRIQPPWHPRFRFANAVCIVTNLPELLRRASFTT